MKKLLFIFLFAALLCGFVNTKALAADSKTEAILYVKQSKQLNVFYNGAAVNPKDVTWKVTSGTGIVKIGKDGIVSAKKKGKAVVTGTYKGGKIEFDFTVKKAPKAKAKSYKVNGLTVKMPKGLIKSDASSSEQTVLEHIKDETQVYINVMAVADFGGATEKQIVDYNRENFSTTVKNSVGTMNGFTITKTEILSDKDLKNGYSILAKEEVKTERPVYVANIAACKNGKFLYITISSNSQDRIESLVKDIIKKNGLSK